eukprot:6067976-Heterocapsa_arctica.AAC.1
MENEVFLDPDAVVVRSDAAVLRGRQRKARTIAARSLPRAFLMYDLRLKCLVGAMLICHCFAGTPDAAELVWAVSRL